MVQVIGARFQSGAAQTCFARSIFRGFLKIDWFSVTATGSSLRSITMRMLIVGAALSVDCARPNLPIACLVDWGLTAGSDHLTFPQEPPRGFARAISAQFRAVVARRMKRKGPYSVAADAKRDLRWRSVAKVEDLAQMMRNTLAMILYAHRAQRLSRLLISPGHLVAVYAGSTNCSST